MLSELAQLSGDRGEKHAGEAGEETSKYWCSISLLDLGRKRSDESMQVAEGILKIEIISNILNTLCCFCSFFETEKFGAQDLYHRTSKKVDSGPLTVESSYTVLTFLSR